MPTKAVPAVGVKATLVPAGNALPFTSVIVTVIETGVPDARVVQFAGGKVMAVLAAPAWFVQGIGRKGCDDEKMMTSCGMSGKPKSDRGELLM